MTPELRRALDDLRAALPNDFNNLAHVGVTNCRRKNNTATGPYSEHAWSNAADLMLGTGGKAATGALKARGDRLAAYMRSRPDMWSEVFWQVAAHYDHVHGTAAPRRNYDNKQIPPCAGGPVEGDDDMASAAQKTLVDLAFNLFPDEVLGDPQVWLDMPEDDPQWWQYFNPAVVRGAKALRAKINQPPASGVTIAQVKAEINKATVKAAT